VYRRSLTSSLFAVSIAQKKLNNHSEALQRPPAATAAHPNTEAEPLKNGEHVLLLRKEVIQPHLPVRLPCYDFVPIASPTFDHSPPYGLGHGLRVLPTFVT
jgi:hypothetical protein